MRKIILIVSSVILLSTGIFAANTKNISSVTKQDVQELNKLSDPKSVQSASDTIDDWAHSAIKKFGINEFGEHNGKFFFFASQSVSLMPSDPQFGDALVNAYDKALMKLQNEYIMARSGKVIIHKIKELHQDNSTNANDIELPAPSTKGFLGKVLKIFDKTLDVTNKKLDSELIKLGTSPQELAQMTPSMKKNTYKDEFLKNIIHTASEQIAGLFPIQTSLAKDANGQYVVGIIAVASQKTIQIAKDISLQRSTLIKGKGKKVEDLLPAEPKDYISTFGVRLSYDLDGTPMIISYGVGSYTPNSGDSYINDQLKSEAKDNAISNADGQIAEIVNGYMNAQESRKNGEEIKKYVQRKMKPNSDTIEKTIKNIVKITNNRAKSHASMSLKGISTVKTWRYTTDKGVKFVGAVRVWKYESLSAVNNFNNEKYKSAKSKTKKPTYKKSLSVSKPVNDVNDF
ncbi:DUF6844 domain-containing protein [Sulfurospirillum sp. 1612]|uniref:DUF6844 domain-containing protein n=1 Tax=Sulfurospirillum sp. 1612 TaxID=3094835 RepID=UPI002F94A918